MKQNSFLKCVFKKIKKIVKREMCWFRKESKRKEKARIRHS